MLEVPAFGLLCPSSSPVKRDCESALPHGVFLRGERVNIWTHVVQCLPQSEHRQCWHYVRGVSPPVADCLAVVCPPVPPGCAGHGWEARRGSCAQPSGCALHRVTEVQPARCPLTRSPGACCPRKECLSPEVPWPMWPYVGPKLFFCSSLLSVEFDFWSIPAAPAFGILARSSVLLGAPADTSSEQASVTVACLVIRRTLLLSPRFLPTLSADALSSCRTSFARACTGA